MEGFWDSNSTQTYRIIRCESLKTQSSGTSNSMAKFKPMRRASYFASLLDVEKVEKRAYLTASPLGLVRMIPAPLVKGVDNLSTWRIQGQNSDMVSSLVDSRCMSGASSGTLHSAVKSANAWDLIIGLGLYWILNSLSSTAHLMRRPDISCFWSICLSGWLVRMTTAGHWKYSLTF